MQVSSLDNGHDVVNGILSCDIAVVGGQLFCKHLVVAGTEPVHACTNQGGECHIFLSFRLLASFPSYTPSLRTRLSL